MLNLPLAIAEVLGELAPLDTNEVTIMSKAGN
jgi:hypothetical protein